MPPRLRLLSLAKYAGVGVRGGSNQEKTHPPLSLLRCCHMVQLCACVRTCLSFSAFSHGRPFIIHHCTVWHAASTVCISPGVRSALVMHTPTSLVISYSPICFSVQFSFIRVTVQHAEKDHFSFKVSLHKTLQIQIRSSWLNKR